MPEQLWLTRLFNDHLAVLANSVLNAVHMPAQDPAHPWQNWMVMELLVVAFILILLPIVRAQLSVDKPGRLQHLFELTYQFVLDQAREVGIQHGAESYVPYFGTLFLFILFMNLLGVIPTFEAPTMNAAVTLGLALFAFVYYHAEGIKAHGIGKYLKHFIGPIPALFFLMIPLEIMGHFARILSLSVRLYANMFAGEQVTTAFIGLTKLIIPVAFMALHVFVCLLQAYIFMLLAMIYVSMATEHEQEPA